MERWLIQEIAYYEVNNQQFYSKKEAEEYSLKLFLVTKLKKIMDKRRKLNPDFEDAINMLEDNKTICYTIYREPFVDTWNAGHYGCTSKPEDRSIYKKFTSIKDFIKFKSNLVEDLYKTADSIDLDRLSLVCNQETIDKMTLYKNMVNKLKDITR